MSMNEMKYEGLRRRLVSQLQQKGITDERVLNAIYDVPRHRFFLPGLVQFSYIDNAYPIDSDQTISQPFTVAYQSQLLQLSDQIKVLEIGTGSGYQSAVLCAAKVQVFSVERHLILHQKAGDLLKDLGYKAQLKFGDGFEGWEEFAPYQRIIITAATENIPQKLLLQLEIGGMMVLPMGGKNGQVMVRITRESETDFKTERFGNFAFVPMLKGTVK